MKEIELHQIMKATGNDFQMTFLAAIQDGDPLTIKDLETSPVPFPIDNEILKEGKKRRLEILKPILAKKLHMLQDAQDIE